MGWSMEYIKIPDFVSNVRNVLNHLRDRAADRVRRPPYPEPGTQAI